MNLDEMMTDAIAALDELWQDPYETAAEYRRMLHRMHEEEQLEEAVDAEPAQEPSPSAATDAMRGTVLNNSMAICKDASSWLFRATEQAGHAGADGPDASAEQSTVTRLGALRVTATVNYAQALLRSGEPQQAVRALSPLIESHPHDERVVGAWMMALAATGRQTEALQTYRRLRLRLSEEMGTDPDADAQQSRLPGADAPDTERQTSSAVVIRQGADSAASHLYLYPRASYGWSSARMICCSDMKVPLLEGLDDSVGSARRRRAAKSRLAAVLVTAMSAAAWPVHSGLAALDHHGSCPCCDRSSNLFSPSRPARKYESLTDWIAVRSPEWSEY